MSPILLAITYVVCLFMGFCGGIFGYIFAKRQENKKAVKECLDIKEKPIKRQDGEKRKQEY